MPEARKETAAQSVLGNPDLVALILEQLDTPSFNFSSSYSRAREANNEDRWAASQVNAVFRGAALRLPVAAFYGGPSRISLDNLVAFCRPRTLRWAFVVTAKNPPVCAALLSRTGSVVEVGISCRLGDCLEGWLEQTPVPPRVPGVGSSCAGPPSVLASLIAHSRLTSLTLKRPGCSGVPWLALLPQLKHVRLERYIGAPVQGLPLLEALDVTFVEEGYARDHFLGSEVDLTQKVVGSLAQWVSPRLTALSLSHCKLDVGSPGTGHAQESRRRADDREVTETCTALKRLEFLSCHISRQGAESLRDLAPCLTYLRVGGWREEHHLSGDAVISRGLPRGLQELSLSVIKHPWSVVLRLTDLVSLNVSQKEACIGGGSEADAVVEGLLLLPKLKEACLTLPGVEKEDGLEEKFAPLEDQLCDRGGYFELNVISFWNL